MAMKGKRSYHHGNLAESLLDAVDDLATAFGLEAVSLRACAKRVGVSPSSAFRHYTDKRALMTAFATRALSQLCDTLAEAEARSLVERAERAEAQGPLDVEPAFLAVGLAYIGFALDKPAFFRAMWREETIYSNDEAYVLAAARLSQHLQGGFVQTIADVDPTGFSPEELLVWSSVHGLANLFVDGPVARGESREDKLAMARDMLVAAMPALSRPACP